ncbi:DUF3604 domain-containing protein [Phenylobacterium sp. LjRoot219]|uniref:DUF3604 domain-containing protein n=1 Tax=Phenylobacterium sp. LjRoot219 TaxID=3342283 RepID=UPI003ECF264B
MIRRRHWLAAAAVAALAVGGYAATRTSMDSAPAPAGRLVSTAHAESAPAERRAYFGELHLHTGYSFDAYVMSGVRTTPEDAYRYAQGLPVEYLGQTVKRARPLDFTAVTDHAEQIGVLNQLDDPKSALSLSEWALMLRTEPLKALRAMGLHSPLLQDKAAMSSAWTREMEAANRHNQPGRFTTFIGYEWTTMSPQKGNLHRNVIFKNQGAEAPFSSADSTRPEELWGYLERLRAKGVEALAIPHNANASGGQMFDWNDSDGRPISEAYAERRALNEPLTEVFQNKGQSETVPSLSPNDEFANFEVMEQLLVGGPSPANGGYARQALGRGQVVESKVGANPFKLGFVGGSDFHNGLSNADENAYAGRGELATVPGSEPPPAGQAKAILNPELNLPGGRGGGGVPSSLYGSAGLTGVWAEANTREAIYAALRRKETFATSGPEIRLRVFGGWNPPADAFKRPDWVQTAYRTGVPMGGDLPARPASGGAPGFIVQAVQDPESGSLDRIQIVKVWLDGDDYREKVFDVVWSPGRTRDPKSGRVAPVRDSVDRKTGAYDKAAGAPTLSGVWRDPEFDPARPAVYYARAIEIPTPRWSTLLAIRRGVPVSSQIPATLQERAISSPIWYTPPPRFAAAAR